MTLAPGTRLGSYEIVEALGAGGMGEVYRARDARLGRDAAIKVLPGDLAGDADRRARFEQEARAASALNHPNILTVYDVGSFEGGAYIATEFVDGKTLRELLVSGALPTRRLLAIAAQVADGLAKAHAAGIVHRDLKPENVMVNKDGFAKILDFGLAKLAAAPEEAGSQLATLVGPGTRPGVVLGTVGYMSPEQASGHAVDYRSDQFSLGAILYEMATGRRAFQKKTAVETLSAIIRDEPEPIGGVNPAAPAPLRWIVERCLAKEPDDRYASTRDLARDLKQALTHLSEASGEAVPVERPRKKRSWWAAAIAALALLGVADLALRLQSAGPAQRRPGTLRRVTFLPGLEDEPSFSPDGKFLAYTTDERGNLDVVVQPLGGGEAIRIAATEADEAEPAWSPDGSKLAFVSAQDRGGRLGITLNVGPLEPYLNGKFGDIFLAPALGGAAFKLVEDGYYPTWSPDGRRIAFMSNREGQVNLWTVAASGGSPVRLTRDEGIDYQPAWSPDGRWIAYGSGGLVGYGYNVAVVAAEGGKPRTLTSDFTFVTRPAWSPDGRSILFSGERNGILNVWRLPFSPDGKPAEPSRVTLGQGQDTDVSVSRDGGKLAFAAVRDETNIWELSVDTGQLREVTSGASGPDYPELAPDGRTLLVSATRTGGRGLWTVDLLGRFLSQLTTGDASEPSAHWSPDGKWVAYVRAAAGMTTELCLLPVGSLAAQETGIPAASPEWSPDGKSIALGSPAGPGEISIYDVPSRKARAVTSVKSIVDYPTWSPDGRRIAFQRQHGSIREIWLVPADGGEAKPLTKDLEDSHPDWSPTNPDEILFLRDHKRLAVASVSTGKVRLLPGYSEGSYVLDYPSWSRDGKKVYFSVARKTGDVYVLEGF